jgi:hypothetical protein
MGKEYTDRLLDSMYSATVDDLVQEIVFKMTNQELIDAADWYRQDDIESGLENDVVVAL